MGVGGEGGPLNGPLGVTDQNIGITTNTICKTSIWEPEPADAGIFLARARVGLSYFDFFQQEKVVNREL